VVDEDWMSIAPKDLTTRNAYMIHRRAPCSMKSTRFSVQARWQTMSMSYKKPWCEGTIPSCCHAYSSALTELSVFLRNARWAPTSLTDWKVGGAKNKESEKWQASAPSPSPTCVFANAQSICG
jgi:hypothetical protein